MTAGSPKDGVLAVIVGSGLNALGVLRSLACGRIPLTLLGPPDGCAMRSRFGTKVALEDTHGEPLIAALRRLAKGRARRPILFLTEEKSVETVSERRDELFDLCRIRLPSRRIVEDLLDKAAFQVLANDGGNLIPAARPLRSPADLADIARLRFPCVLKPAWKNYEYGRRFSKAYVVTSMGDVERLYAEIFPFMPDMIVQEWIEGDDSDIYFCLQYIGDGGTAVASFVGRKLRSWPPRIGGTASCIAAPEHAHELTIMTQRFFQRVGFEGMGSMEYKRDRRDGRFYMVEPTVGRTDFQEEVATVNGVNIPLAAYRHESGMPPLGAVTVVPPRLWRDPVVDRWARQQQTSPLAERDATHCSVDAYFRPDDPGPWVDSVLHRLGGKLRAVIKSR